jgi:acylglycerol lipase
MVYEEFGWRTADGLQIYGRNWRPDTGPVKAVVCLVHGLGEHSGRYEYLADSLCRAGYAMMAFDLRGHGRSEGKRGHAVSYEALMDDIAHSIEEAEVRYPKHPIFIYGHSLGGNLVLNFVLRRQPRLSGAIVTGPLLRTTRATPWWKMWAARILYVVWPSVTLSNGLRREDLSRDTQVAGEYERDPLVHNRMSAQLGVDAFEAGRWAENHANQLALPLLLMHGDEDRITSVEASREFAARAGDVCTLVIWPGLFHEVHKSPEKEQVLTCALEWMESHR